MPLRADFPDGLARLQRAQRRNKPPAEQQRQDKAAQHRNKDPDQRRFHFLFPHMFFRFQKARKHLLHMHAVAALEQQRVSCAAGLLQRSDERIVRGKGPCPGKPASCAPCT